MKTLQVKEYNRLQGIKYDKACREWQPLKGGFPCAEFYYFSYNGNFRRTGYVAYDDYKSIWRPTKHEAIKAFEL
jgi:hypothetical protein